MPRMNLTMDSKQILVLSSELVNPSRIPPNLPAELELSPFDNLMGYANYQKRMLFYRSAPENITDLLKNSLAEVLVHFYPLASRIRTGNNGVLVLDCSSVELSARFTAAATEIEMDQLGLFEPSEFSDSLCQFGSSTPKHPWKVEDPLLFVQITRFGCGGVCLGIGFSHQVLDGVSFWHFMACWGEIARTGKVISPLPEITYNYKALEFSDEEEYLKIAPECGCEILPEIVQSPFGSQTNSPLATRQYRFDRPAIAELKSRAKAGGSNADVRFFSTYVVLCAEFWRRTVIARGFPDSDMARFFVLANCRERIPSLPKHYFGNAISAFAAAARVGELKREGLPLAARLIHDVIKALNGDRAERVLSFMLWTIAAPRRVRIVPYGQAVSSNQHPVEKAEFGFGQPDGVTFGTNDLHEGKIYLFPDKNGGVVVTAVLNEESMKRMIDEEEEKSL